MDTTDDWTWPTRPTNAADFDAMMVSVDRHLALHNLKPAQRSTMAMRLVSMAFHLGTPMFGVMPPRDAPFSDTDLLPRVIEWYEANFGQMTQSDISPGSAVLWLHGTYRRIKVPMLLGGFDLTINRNLDVGAKHGMYAGNPPPINALSLVADMTSAYASRLSDDELAFIGKEVITSLEAIWVLDGLSGHELFEQARGDYSHAVEALLAGNHLSKARWDTAQCAEKVLKGLLARAGHKYPTFGAKGHDILELGRLVTEKLGLAIPDSALRSIQCSPSVRYGEMNVDQNEAYCSHKDLLSLLRRIGHWEQHRGQKVKN